MFKECLGSNYTSREGSYKDKKPRNQDHGFGLEKRKKRRVCKQKQEKEL